MKFGHYDTKGFYDEMFADEGSPRPGYLPLMERIESLPEGEIKARQAAAEQLFYDMGITFTVYGHSEGTEKIFPFDIIPRIIERSDWEHLERGLKQRIYALNLFIDDIYHDQKIVKDGIVPLELIESADGYFHQCSRTTSVPRQVFRTCWPTALFSNGPCRWCLKEPIFGRLITIRPCCLICCMKSHRLQPTALLQRS